jgi:hypothetical protein
MSHTINRGAVATITASILFWIALAVFTGLALAGCGGGDGATTEAPPAPTCTPHAGPVTIGLWGDSTNYGETADASGNYFRAAVYPELVIQRAMDARFGAGAVVVSTHAINGTALHNLLIGSDEGQWGRYQAWPLGADDDIEVENFGIHDFGSPADHVTPEVFASELRTMYAARHVVMETPLPIVGGDVGYAQVVRDVAGQLGAPLIDVSAYAKSLPDWSQWTGDGEHPTSDGYTMLETNAVVPALVPMVAALRCSP